MRIIYCSILALISTVIYPTFVSDETLSFSNSILSLVFFAFCFFILYKQQKNNRLNIYTHVLGLLFSCFIAFGHSLDVYSNIQFHKLFFCIVVYAHIIACLLNLLWSYLISVEEKLENFKLHSAFEIRVMNFLDWFFSKTFFMYIALFLFWVPGFIADFPGGFRYDAFEEFNQINEGFNGDFPLLHSVIVTRLLFYSNSLTGSYNIGVAVYVVAQMLLMAYIYTKLFFYLYQKNVNRLLLAIAFVYCALFPVIQILVVQEVRDVLFSVLLIYLIYLMYVMQSDKELFWGRVHNPILLSAVLVLTVFARNNNANSVMLFGLIILCSIIWLKGRKKYFKGVTIFSVSCILIYILLGGILISLCQPLSKASESASLSLMSQSIVRAYLYENDSWRPEEKEELAEYILIDDIHYYPEFADTTKRALNIHDNFADFFFFWCKMGIKYPQSYMNAILANTQNMWYPDSVIDGYKQAYANEGDPYYEFDKNYYSIYCRTDKPVIHMDYCNKLLDYYTNIGLNISFEKIPVISMFFSIGFQFWLILNCICYILYRKKTNLYLPVFVILIYMLISAFVPIVLLRYFAAAFFATPMIFIFTLQPSRCN